MVASIHIVTHEEVVGFLTEIRLNLLRYANRRLAANLEELHEIVKLAMNISADSDR